MKNENGTKQQLWAGGQNVVITADKDKQICLVSNADEVKYNPYTLEKILEVWKKNQKEL